MSYVMHQLKPLLHTVIIPSKIQEFSKKENKKKTVIWLNNLPN